MPAGQVNFMVSLPHSTSNVLEPMLHPVTYIFMSVYFGDTSLIKSILGKILKEHYSSELYLQLSFK